MRLARTVLLASLIALVVVPAALAIRFTDDSYNMPPGVVGQSYSKQFNGAGGCGPALPYQYSLIGGKLPAGLSLSSSGLISGTPTQAGNSSFWVNLSDQNPPTGLVPAVGGAAPVHDHRHRWHARACACPRAEDRAELAHSYDLRPEPALQLPVHGVGRRNAVVDGLVGLAPGRNHAQQGRSAVRSGDHDRFLHVQGPGE